MTKALYDSAREAFLSGDLDWLADTYKVLLVSSGYTFSSTHAVLSDVPSGARVATSGALTGKTATAGVADADDVTISAVSGSQITGLIIYQDTGVEATSKLVCYVDEGTGIPLTPNGGDVVVTWSSSAERIFKL